MLDTQKMLSFYNRPEIRSAILDLARDREIAVKFGEKGFGKRPEILRYERDIIEFVIAGATSFHISEERWKNPLLLRPGMRKEEQDELRIGWDLVIDIDCPYFPYSIDTAYLVIEWLKHSRISSISCKFSGNKGFHIGVPFEAFPAKIIGKESRLMFPETPKRVAEYIQEKIKRHLAKLMLDREGGDLGKVMRKVGAEKAKEIIGIDETGPYATVDIDTVLISSRHLYRSVYSFHEKSGLVSVPVDPEKILEFEKDLAKPENIKVPEFRFLDPVSARPDECIFFFNQAFDFRPVEVDNEEKVITEVILPEEAIPESCFPPCIRKIKAGLKDGKKRAMFILTNFLKSCGWGSEEIEKFVKEWNKRNPDHLRENVLISHLRGKKGQKPMLPSNCVNSIYKDLGVCEPDNLCSKVRNPVQYAKRKNPTPS